MPKEVASSGQGRIEGGQKTGLEQSKNARRNFIVSLTGQLRNLDNHLDILALAARLLGEFLPAERAGAYCLENGELELLACWTAGRLPLLTGRRPLAVIGPRMAEQYRARHTVVATDVVAEGMQHTRTPYSAVGVPLFRKGQWEGTFFINRPAGQTWRADEVSLIEEVAELSWDAHERAEAAQKLREANDSLRRRERELSAALRAAALVPFEYDFVGQAMKPSPELNRLYGYPPEHGLTLADIRARYHPDISARFLQEMAAQVKDPGLKEYELNLHLLLPGGEVRWLNGRGEYFRDDKGVATRTLGVVMDVTRQKKLEQTQRLLVREMDHRIKNVLTTVMAICTQTIRNSDTLHEARLAVIERIKALASAHDVLVKTKWGPAGIKEVIAGACLPYPEMMKRVSFDGPDCVLSARQALMFALTLHELITNALKYGALSNDHGRISATWSLQGEHQTRLVFTWKEEDGPPVVTPLKTGFGSRILSEVLPAEFHGRAILSYAREGFSFQIEGTLADVPR